MLGEIILWSCVYVIAGIYVYRQSTQICTNVLRLGPICWLNFKLDSLKQKNVDKASLICLIRKHFFTGLETLRFAVPPS